MLNDVGLENFGMPSSNLNVFKTFFRASIGAISSNVSLYNSTVFSPIITQGITKYRLPITIPWVSPIAKRCLSFFEKGKLFDDIDVVKSPITNHWHLTSFRISYLLSRIKCYGVGTKYRTSSIRVLKNRLMEFLAIWLYIKCQLANKNSPVL